MRSKRHSLVFVSIDSILLASAVANIKSIFQHVLVCIPVVCAPSGSTSQLNCQWFWLLGFQSVPVAQACITSYSFYSLPHALLCTRHLFVWYLHFSFFLSDLPWGFVIGFLQFTGYYFTFAQKFKFQCDWCMGSWGLVVELQAVPAMWVVLHKCTLWGSGYRASVGLFFPGYLHMRRISLKF